MCKWSFIQGVHSRDEWSYRTDEIDHGGNHTSHYEAKREQDGIRFRKRRESSGFKHADIRNEKASESNYAQCKSKA